LRWFRHMWAFATRILSLISFAPATPRHDHYAHYCHITP
jgi:hypothetical protein